MLKGKKDVIKHSAAIHIQNNITLLQRRAWNVLLANAYDELPNEDIVLHRMPVRELMIILEFDSHNMEYLKEALSAIVSCKVEWNLLGKAKEEWKATTLLAEVGIERESENGPYICTYAYGPTLRERLYNPRMYARISLSMQNKFNSKYAQALWELCTDYLDEARNFGETPFLTLEDVKKLIGVADDGYGGEFKILNRDVIKPALKEINEVTDFHVRAEHRYQGRKITGIKFLVSRLLEIPSPIQRQKDLFVSDKDTPVVVRELKKAGLAVEDAWKIWQQGFEYLSVEKRPQNMRFETYILEKIDLLKRRQKAGGVKSITGFLIKAIKQNFANPEFALEANKQRVREQTKTKQLSVQHREILKEKRSEIETERDKEIHQLCVKIIEETPTLLEQMTASLFKENSVLKKACEPGKSLIDNYQEKTVLRVTVDQYLMDHHPERFEAIRKHYDAQIATLE